MQAIIFDRDGVLVDFDIQGGSQALGKLLPPECIPQLVPHWREYMTRIGGPRTLHEETHFWQGFWDYLGDRYDLSAEIRVQLKTFDYTRYIRPYPDARPALLAAKHMGLKTAVLSNFALASLEETLMATHLYDLVDVACAATVIGVAKPDPAAYQYVINQLAVDPAECLFFDDKESWVEGARSCGLRSYLVDRRRPAHDLEHQIVCDLTIVSQLLSTP